ncbi:MAG: cysteine--tRNA ligase [Methylomonas sp.]|nr:cysteine--tRNA ligase [Methylomonas sp.]
MNIRLYSTLTGAKEDFKPITAGRVSMYHCGPTVYDYAHIGNLRSYIFADTLRRVFEANGYAVTQAINITDVGHLSTDADTGEDKMTKALAREGKPLTLDAMRDVADFYADRFAEDLKNLNIKAPHAMPKASDHIAEDIEIISLLEKKGFVYATSDGLYFDTNKYPAYGKLGNRGGDETAGATRIGEHSEKKNPRDFAVWKFNSSLGWDTPWGKGFPGWHIECSAMARKYLGQPFDIHTGGIDHISIHHNNEIAQSECAYESPLANYWLHNEFITVNEGKMSKSKGNFLTLKGLKESGVPPLGYRYWLLTTHYRSPISFSLEALAAAVQARHNLSHTLAKLPEGGAVSTPHREHFLGLVSDDMNTPQALAYIWDIIKDEALTAADKRATIIACDAILGLALSEESRRIKDRLASAPQTLHDLIKERSVARQNKQWDKADTLRTKIEEAGYLVRDEKDGSFLDVQ